MLPKKVQTAFSQLLEKQTQRAVELRKITPIGGGCINESFRIDTNAGPFFIKYNDARRYPGMFEAEAKGLALLGGRNADRQGVWKAPLRQTRGTNDDIDPNPEKEHRTASLRIPDVIGCAEDEQYSLLALEYLPAGSMRSNFWEAFGLGLARLHRLTYSTFGSDHNNYIGSLPQSNKPHDNWIAFYIEERLEAQLKLARDSSRADRELGKRFQGLYPHLADFFPVEPPALLHGDLWSGNYMVASDGHAAIIDPAVYYGHRLMDLGMTQLFGGFAPVFYEAYHSEYPLEKGWQSSIEIANLYPLMVHVNLFGGGYLGSVKSTLKKFS
jgi:protein-ribulosamine 3-kinase